MIRIFPQGRTQILDSELSDASDLLTTIDPETRLCEPSERPSVELSYKEISEQELSEVLGYGSLTTANSPLGLPCDFEPRQHGAGVYVFPLPRLAAHLHKIDPDLVGEYKTHATFEQFLDARDLTARDYLITGVLQCIKWCEEHRAALAIEW